MSDYDVIVVGAGNAALATSLAEQALSLWRGRAYGELGMVLMLRVQVPPPPADAKFPGLFTAIQEQLGLKLESVTAPVEVMVIDRVERPSEN